MKFPFRRKPKPHQCEFVGNGLRCMRIVHETGDHSTGRPLPYTVWNGERWAPMPFDLTP